MKISESWLREWVNPQLTTAQLGDRLTMAGLEIEEIVALQDGNDGKKDFVIDISITPNRGDCLSIRGLAHEVSAITETPLTPPACDDIRATHIDVIPVKIEVETACPAYVGRIIKNVSNKGDSPEWLRARLQASGVSVISPVVDVTNYVMLELGQPMHAFTLEKIEQGIVARMAHDKEKLTLLDDREIVLDADTLIIADAKKPLALAGVMGGLESAVTERTKNVFLEAGWFTPETVAKAARRYKVNTDTAYRYERGVDPQLQRKAIERATQLLIEIVGGEPGEIIEVRAKKYLPPVAVITLRADRIKKILGCKIPAETVTTILERLGFTVETGGSSWQVTIPSRRGDVTTEIDLIEEVARVYGYEKIPCHDISATLSLNPRPEKQLSLSRFRNALTDQGYQEVVTYSFIDKKFQELFSPEHPSPELLNPMTAEMSVMRGSLWSGLVTTLLYNQNRQQPRVRIFETGLRYLMEGGELQQQTMLSGLVSGTAFPEQWGIAKRPVDFFDVKGDLQNLFALTHAENDFHFKPGQHAALHPGQTADIYRGDEFLGIMGQLHPKIIQTLKIEGPVVLFELMLSSLTGARVPHFASMSKFPEIRRDLAILLDQSVPGSEIQDTIRHEAGELLKAIDIFDVYQGKGIEPGKKSIALALTLQHASRTLRDEEVAELLERVIVALKGRFNADLRG
jgi:phenylalanyl-tRNA synthetase beta chain